MGVTLHGENGESIRCNWWCWRPTVQLLLRNGLPGEQLARDVAEGTDGAIVSLTADEAVRAAEIVDALLATLPEDGRILLDGATTTRPDTFELFRGDQSHANYSATHAWLVELSDFCKRSQGFTAS